VRSLLYQLTSVDLTQIHGIGSGVALTLIAECGTDMSRWPTEKHFTSWLTTIEPMFIAALMFDSTHNFFWMWTSKILYWVVYMVLFALCATFILSKLLRRRNCRELHPITVQSLAWRDKPSSTSREVW